MWIEGGSGTRNITLRERGDDGKVTAVYSADFNHNGRAEVEKKMGDLLLKTVTGLKTVKDGGPPPPKADEEEEASEALKDVNEEEENDG